MTDKKKPEKQTEETEGGPNPGCNCNTCISCRLADEEGINIFAHTSKGLIKVEDKDGNTIMVNTKVARNIGIALIGIAAEVEAERVRAIQNMKLIEILGGLPSSDAEDAPKKDLH